MPRKKANGLEKPANVANDPFKSAKWGEITSARTFSTSDVPALLLLVQWHAVAQQCIDDIDDVGQVAYQNKLGDLKALPQISTLKQASAEIRQLNKQLGINDAAEPEKKKTKQASMLQFVMNDRAKKAKRVNGG